MLPLVEFPQIVQHYAPWFEIVFSAEALVQFRRYLSGSIVSENKTVSEAVLNQQRLAPLNSLEGTRVKPKGVLSVDDTLLTHHGRHFDEIAFLYDPVDDRYTWAHNLHYSDDRTDYPFHFQSWKPADLDQLGQGLREAGIRSRKSKFLSKQATPRNGVNIYWAFEAASKTNRK